MLSEESIINLNADQIKNYINVSIGVIQIVILKRGRSQIEINMDEKLSCFLELVLFNLNSNKYNRLCD